MKEFAELEKSFSLFEKVDLGIHLLSQKNFLDEDLIRSVVFNELQMIAENTALLYRATTDFNADSTRRRVANILFYF